MVEEQEDEMIARRLLECIMHARNGGFLGGERISARRMKEFCGDDDVEVCQNAA